MLTRTPRLATVVVAAACIAISGASGVANGELLKDNDVYFVHGYGDSASKVCEDPDDDDAIWNSAVADFEDRGWDPDALHTVGYYEGDTRCDLAIGGQDATADTPIQDIARDLAKAIYEEHGNREPVEIVGHSMGGLIARVAVIGSAHGWHDFPPPLKVDDVVTLGTPHQGVRDADTDKGEQWQQMQPDSGFIKRLHDAELALDNHETPSVAMVDWSFVGSEQDDVVTENSAIDLDEHADHKYKYLDGNDPEISHTTIRTDAEGEDHAVKYWHRLGGSDTIHDAASPVELAYRAVVSRGA